MPTPTARADGGPANGSGKITRDVVLAAALEIIDRDGADATVLAQLQVDSADPDWAGQLRPGHPAHRAHRHRDPARPSTPARGENAGRTPRRGATAYSA
jgi:hypothetical protein